MRTFFYPLMLFCLFACGNPVEEICSIYEDGADKAVEATNMVELNEVRKETANGIEEIVVANRREVNEILSGADGYALLQRLNNAEKAYTTAISNKVKAIYPPASQLCDLYAAATDNVLAATDINGLETAMQSLLGSITKLNSEFPKVVETMSVADKQRVSSAEQRYNDAVAKKKDELGVD